MIDLKAKREACKVTQEALANATGIQRQAISAYERGIAKPTVENAKKIAKILCFNWSEFYED